MTENNQDGKFRCSIRAGSLVDIVQKEDQKSGRITRGIVYEILTNSSFHPHGIKVRLKDGRVGRVDEIVEKARNDSAIDYTTIPSIAEK